MTDAMIHNHSGHGDAELLAAFVDGQLEPEELQVVTTHLASCEECRALIGEAAAFEQEQEVATPVKSKRAWMAAAAAVVVGVVAGYPFGRDYLHDRKAEKDRQAVIATQEERVVEARFSGQDAYAPYRNYRSKTGDEKDHNYAREAAISQLMLDTEKDTSPTALRARALGLAADKKAQAAVDLLNGIPVKTRDAATWNDIAALNNAAGHYDVALAAVEQALKLQPKMREALFNKAVILHVQDKSNEAIAAYDEYLKVDSSGPWADEAQKKIDDIRRLQ